MDKKKEVASKMVYGRINGHKGPKQYGALKPQEEKGMLDHKQKEAQKTAKPFKYRKFINGRLHTKELNSDEWKQE